MSDKILAMIVWRRQVLGWLRSVFCAREDLILENLALRQQLLALHAQRPRRRLNSSHKLFWVVLRRLWARWKEPLILVTVVTENSVRSENTGVPIIREMTVATTMSSLFVALLALVASTFLDP